MGRREYDDDDDLPVGLPYSDQETSRDAAESMVEHAAAQDARVIKALQATMDGPRVGLTAEELSLALCIRINSVTPRCKGLRDRGVIVRTGEKRRGTSGRNHSVYGIATEGVATPEAKRKGVPLPTAAAERVRVLKALEDELEARGMQLFREQLLEGVRARLAS